MSSYWNVRGPAKLQRVQPASYANLRSSSSSFKSKNSKVTRSSSGVGVKDSNGNKDQKIGLRVQPLW
ncbi:hypothetical protein HanRHA438_Chr09g0393501 [Helianthus annuus]|uniref:Uncharacterized protein n=1 Tax=Helianthus annuus TaxID=4232 RepID=A0A251TV18_HELAN|nr:hypothetical protein HanXRQr2_Chr09g0382031 [Helianthus annuus]KAJ0525565.1 hypothetical protein HanHA300_Chr09g0313511 [Helianthus annuus]KAJ0533725.1 hypothetical protein HanIR_Chr09g0411701 [Helianthus annuus]KAJ0541950.1 hypothetical protein HanHA89_Chr09g0334401 [Helianthus annuus]KAJ0707018.1 hypothetical protein HanLR1_Chr09g0313771 [Helianthus annuus]